MIRALLLCLSLLFLSSCSSKSAEIGKSYSISNQQIKRPDIYYPVRSVRSASPGASEYPSNPTKRIILKKFSYEIPESNVCEVGQALARSLNYDFYCAQSLEFQDYQVTQILTPYELKDLMEADNNVNVMIDHINRTVRILEGAPIVPQISK